MDSGFADAQTLYQHHQLLQQLQQQQPQQQYGYQQEQEAQSLLHQQQQRSQFGAQFDETSLQQPAFVAPSALSSGPEVIPSVTSGRHSSISTQSSSAWKDSPNSNLSESFSSPASSIVSPQSSDVSPPTPVDPLDLGPSQKKEQQQLTEMAETPRRRRGRPRLSEAGTHAAAAVVADGGQEGAAAGPRKKQQKKAAAAARRKSNASTTSGADEFRDDPAVTGTVTTNDDKKSRVRARNREAAYKCRQKKQKGIEELQSQEAVVESANKNLAAEAAALRSEILMLKSMVLQHGGCGCTYIEEYISGAAANLVQSRIAPATSTASASQAPDAASGHDEGLNAQKRQQQDDVGGGSGGGGMMGWSGGTDGGDAYVDWNMLDMERSRPAAVPGLASESGFSGYDDSAAHSVRSQSQGAMMA